MKKILLSAVFALISVSGAYAFEFLPYTAIRGSLYLTATDINDEKVSTVVPAFASSFGLHFGKKTRLEFEYNSHALAGNQIPSQISDSDLYVSIKIETYMLNLFYDLYKDENHEFFVGAGAGAANATFFIPYDAGVPHSGVEGYLCAAYSAYAGMAFKLLKRVDLETMFAFNSVIAPFDGINNINSFGICLGLRFDTQID